MTEAEFEAAGLYDPRSATAEQRLALLRWLDERGVTLEQMVAGRGSLSGLAGDLALRPGRRITAREIAAQLDLDVEQVLNVSLAAGLSPRTADALAYTEEDVDLFEIFAGGAAMFGAAATRHFTRVVGSSLSRIAEAAVSLFQVNVEQPMLEAGGSELALAQQNLRAIEALTGVQRLLQGLFGAHLETAIRRLREARLSRSPEAVMFAVGFIDLVGFTTLSRDLAARELAELVERFEDTAYDVVAVHDGRVVKLIGDEVMFVTRTATAACETALGLLERFAGDAAVTPRGAIAFGEMLVRGGDYYGPIVNLASRVAQIAVPNELLVTPQVAEQSDKDTLLFAPAGKRMLKGLNDPVTLLTVTRAGA
jgi:adenylate cyclase